MNITDISRGFLLNIKWCEAWNWVTDYLDHKKRLELRGTREILASKWKRFRFLFATEQKIVLIFHHVFMPLILCFDKFYFFRWCCQQNQLFDASIDRDVAKTFKKFTQLEVITNSGWKSFGFLKSFYTPVCVEKLEKLPRNQIAILWLFDLMKNSEDALSVLIIFVSWKFLLRNIKKLEIHRCFVRIVEGEVKGCWKMDEFKFLC